MTCWDFVLTEKEKDMEHYKMITAITELGAYVSKIILSMPYEVSATELTKDSFNIQIEIIRNLMESMKWTAEQAMSAMKISDKDKSILLKRL